MFITKRLIEQQKMFAMLSSYETNPTMEENIIIRMLNFLNTQRESVLRYLPGDLLKEIYNKDGKIKDIDGGLARRILRWRDGIDRELLDQARAWKDYFDTKVKQKLPESMAMFMEKNLHETYYHNAKLENSAGCLILSFERFVWGRVKFILYGTTHQEKPEGELYGLLHAVEVEVLDNNKMVFQLLFEYAEVAVEVTHVDFTVENFNYVSYLRLHGGDFKSLYSDIGHILTDKEFVLGFNGLSNEEKKLIDDYRKIVPEKDKKKQNKKYYNFYRNAVEANKEYCSIKSFDGCWKWVEKSLLETYEITIGKHLKEKGYRGSFPRFFKISKGKFYLYNFEVYQAALKISIGTGIVTREDNIMLCDIIPIYEAGSTECAFDKNHTKQTIGDRNKKYFHMINRDNVFESIKDILTYIDKIDKKLENVWMSKDKPVYFIAVGLPAAIFFAIPAAFIVGILGWVINGFKGSLNISHMWFTSGLVGILVLLLYYKQRRKLW